jgi:hypothetical protein
MGGRVGGWAEEWRDGMGGKTKGFIKTKSLGWVVCEVWVDRWAEE